MKKKLLLSLPLVALLTLTLVPPTSAATPPDSCFAFDAGTGTITDYYDHEGNNSANPACPRDVDIPSTIGGVSVTAIGDAMNVWDTSNATSFACKSLTSVTIPSGVISIGNNAFRNNQLSAVSIPNSITSIGDYAFMENELGSMALPNSVTHVGDQAFMENNIESVTLSQNMSELSWGIFENNQITSVTIPDTITVVGEYAFASNRITSLVVGASVTTFAEGAFMWNSITEVEVPSTLTSIDSWSFYSQSDVNNPDNKFYTRVYTADPSNPAGLIDKVTYYYGESQGGHIINPASISVLYKNQEGTSVDETVYYTGEKSDGTLMTNYYISDGPTITAHVNGTVAGYYRIGDEITIDPPAIDGYITPPAQKFVLGAADNEFSYIYTTPEDEESGVGAGADSGSSNEPAAGGELANTGMNGYAVALVGVALIMSAMYVFGRLRKASYSKFIRA